MIEKHSSSPLKEGEKKKKKHQSCKMCTPKNPENQIPCRWAKKAMWVERYHQENHYSCSHVCKPPCFGDCYEFWCRLRMKCTNLAAVRPGWATLAIPTPAECVFLKANKAFLCVYLLCGCSNHHGTGAWHSQSPLLSSRLLIPWGMQDSPADPLV